MDRTKPSAGPRVGNSWSAADLLITLAQLSLDQRKCSPEPTALTPDRPNPILDFREVVAVLIIIYSVKDWCSGTVFGGFFFSIPQKLLNQKGCAAFTCLRNLQLQLLLCFPLKRKCARLRHGRCDCFWQASACFLRFSLRCVFTFAQRVFDICQLPGISGGAPKGRFAVLKTSRERWKTLLQTFCCCNFFSGSNSAR